MVKNKTKKLIIFVAVVDLLLFTTWGVLLFLANNESQAISNFLLGQTEDPLTANVSTSFLTRTKGLSLDDYFLTSSSTLKLLDTLELASKQTGVKMSLSQGGEQDGSLKLNLQASGRFEQLTKLLSQLENLPYASRIERLQLSKGVGSISPRGGNVPSPVKTQAGDWQANFTLAVLQDKSHD